MADTNKPIEAAWITFATKVTDPRTPQWQMDQMKSIFFAGALAVSVAINEANRDQRVNEVFDDLEAEFDAWEAGIRKRIDLTDAPPAGRA